MINFEQAITIPITDVLEKLGHLPVKKNSRDYWYLSPLRAEKTASFKVNLSRNAWFDFGINKGGGIIRFTEAWLQSEGKSGTYKEALVWLSDLSGIQPSVKPYIHVEEKKRIELKAVKSLRAGSLLSYLHERGITPDIATLYLRELSLFDNETGKRFSTIGFKNNKGGYENRRWDFKGCIEPKAITTIHGTDSAPEGVHLFEGFIDFLSLLMIENKLKLADNVIVLNSVITLKQALPLLNGHNYKFVYTWFDNDATGNKATEEVKKFCEEQTAFTYTPMNASYEEHKDVNEWLLHLLS